MGSGKKAEGKKNPLRKSPEGKTRIENGCGLSSWRTSTGTFIFDKTQTGDARILWPSADTSNKQAFQDLADVVQVLGARMSGQAVNVSGAFPRRFAIGSSRSWPSATGRSIHRSRPSTK